MNFYFPCIPLILILGSIPSAIAQTVPKPAAFEPTERYETRQIQGWTVRYHPALLKEKDDLAGKVFDLLNQQLFQVVRKVPPAAVAKLKTVTIWLEVDEPHHPCMAYHPGKDWLIDHGMNPDKARGVEIANARNFLDWTLDQPWMVFHEFAHAYHDQFVPEGFENPSLKERYRAAMAGGLYRKVLRCSGVKGPAYAENNPMEYFAEASEAYFGANDFYPFVWAELKKHDPLLETVLGELWARP